jgi:hypothetical protein
MDGVVQVTGTAPASSGCNVAVYPVGSQPRAAAVAVSGTFRTEFVVYPSRKGHAATLECAGTIVARRQFVYGRDVDVGGEVSLDGHAP